MKVGLDKEFEYFDKSCPWLDLECCEKMVENRKEKIEGKVYGKEKGLLN